MKFTKKLIALGLAGVMTLSMGASAFASSSVPVVDVDSVETIFESMVDYSTYNYQSETWELDYAIVEDDVLTETQFNSAEELGEFYEELNPNTRALPSLLVIFLKTLAASGAATLAYEIVQDFYTYGMVFICEKFSVLSGFCEANDYI